MTDILRGFAKMLIMLLPFLVLCLANAWANLRREIRYKQFLMPFAAVLITLVAMYLLTDIHDQSEELLRYVIRELERFAGWLTRNTRLEPGSFALWLRDSVQKLTEWIQEQNLTYWAFYVANASARGIPCVWWDNNGHVGNGELFGLMNRAKLAWAHPEIVEALTRYSGWEKIPAKK